MEVVEQKPQRQEQLQQAEEEGTGMSDPLYTDLDLPAADVQTNELQSRLAEAERRIRTLEGKAALVGNECVRLRAENETLRRNASSLYRTAKRELARKEVDIAALREQVRSLQRITPPPPPLLPGGQHRSR